MRASDRSTIAVVLALFLTIFTLTPLTVDGTFLGLSWLLFLVLGTLTIVMRRARFGAGVVLAAQLAVWLLTVLGLSASLEGPDEPWYGRLVSQVVAGIQHMQTQASPMDPDDGVKLIFVSAIVLFWIVTEFLVGGIRHPVWAIAPLGALFGVPALGLGTDTGVASFLCVALGYLAILVAEGLNSTARWTRGLSSDSAAGQDAGTSVVWRAAGLIGAPVLVLTIVLGMLLPTFSLSGFGWGTGTGGNGPLQLSDPTLDLRRNLNQPLDKEVIRYRSNKPGGLYLRMASLPQFNASGWSNVEMQLDAGEQLSQIPGVAAEPSARRSTRIQVLDFKSEYLPLPFAPRSFDAAGNWAFDPQSLTVLSMARGDRASALQNLTYTVDSVDIAPQRSELDNSVAGSPADASITRAIPSDLPPELTALTQKVTAGADSDADKAAAIQDYLRSSRFTYTTEALPGTGYEALTNFLTDDYKGYCEQFAAGMAVMARVAGIPSRVSIGFLPGDRKGDQWSVSIRDMHAWPELYFAGLGWVRFEPTPESVTGTAPSWTEQNGNAPSNEESAEPSVAPSTETEAPSSEPTSGPVEQTTDVTTAPGFPWRRTLLGSGVGLLVLLVLAAPATIRTRRRNDRLSGDRPVEERVEAVWQEIRDTVVDYGGSWPDGSPRAIGGEISHRLEGPDSDTMTRVATMVERSRYAQSYRDEEGTRALPAMAQDIRRGIAQPQSRWRRFRAVVAPRSLLRRGHGRS